tara:strand:+ start:62 stop:2416 length:2355 start_codon:yes stop_codon:yes gene_type:complete
MIKKIIYTLITFSLSFSQIERGGEPKFYENRINNINYILVDSNSEINREFNPMVFQFGYEYELIIDVLEESRIIETADETTFLIGIESPGAYGIGLNFSNFRLSPNSRLFFYDEPKTFRLGSFNSDNNKPANTLVTSIIKGDKIIIELTVPNNELDLIDLEISSIIHDYSDIMNYFNTIESNRDDCNSNVNCPEGDEWRDQINGVVRVTMGGGLCSASIVNNTANDRTPYILFADHCVSGSASGYVFHFNYQSSTCTGTAGSLNQSISGSTLLASEDINSGADVALLELTSNIPDSYDPFYVGWSRSSTPPQQAVGIHHPGGDTKRISFTNDNVSAGGSGSNYWEFEYNDGRVIPGSSGSPFFDQNKRQVGIASYIYTNYCDPSPDCYCDQQYNHGYGRFDRGWDSGFGQYLDPINSGATAIDGIGNSGINIVHSNISDTPYTSSSITFSADATSYSGTIDAVQLNYDIGNGWETLELNQNFGTNTYESDLTNLYDGMLVKYYIMAVDSEGIVQTYPANAPDNYVIFILGDLPDFYVNDFENSIEGWVVGDESDNASSGIWELAIPTATFNDDNIQIQPGVNDLNEGQYCFVTGNGNEEGNGGFDDVDNGKTTLYSPTFDLSNFDEIVLSYWRWYTNDVGDNGDSDKWDVSVSNNGGLSWLTLEYISSSLTEFSKQTFLLSDITSLTSEMVFKFVAEDIFYDGNEGSGGSLVEAAIDDFKLEFISENMLGDLNSDLEVNVLDVVVLINMILGTEAENYSTGDLNSDNQINVQDIILVVNIIIGN